jgi:hypothetical protein
MRRFFLPVILFVTLTGGQAFAAKEKTKILQPTNSFAQGNQNLEDILSLQHQIQLISRLVERERVVNDMASGGKAIGLNEPQLSRPDRNLCAQIPANILCAQAYGDLYEGFDVTPVANVAPPVQQIIEQAETPAIAEEIVQIEPDLYWLDITCLDNACSALLARDPNDRNSLARVRVGDQYEGAQISAISTGGVILMRNGRTIRAVPAPKG